MIDSLLQHFENIVVVDTETTGFSPVNDEVIELAAIAVTKDGIEEMDDFVTLSPGRRLPAKIIELTGITDELLAAEGQPKAEVAARFAGMISRPKTLIVAYNAQFDLCFLYHMLNREGLAGALQGVRMLDALTVFKDRRPFPHKLCNAIEAYSLQGQNTHRAIDDTKATLELLDAMERERPDLDRYVNLFGYIPKYGAPKPRISSVTYRPQGYDTSVKLYEK